jgi:hypothetical protein
MGSTEQSEKKEQIQMMLEQLRLERAARAEVV